MKLVAIEKATGKRWPVKEASFEDSETWIAVQTGKQSYVYERVGERYTLHISTCTFDKHEREILDVDSLLDDEGVIWKAIWDGHMWRVLTCYGNASERQVLTPELARQMEVVE